MQIIMISDKLTFLCSLAGIFIIYTKKLHLLAFHILISTQDTI